MTYVHIIQSTTLDADSFLETLRQVGEEPIDGLLARYAGPAAGGFTITAVWESKAHADRFAIDRLVPAIRAAHGEATLAAGPGASIEYDAVDTHVPTTV